MENQTSTEPTQTTDDPQIPPNPNTQIASSSKSKKRKPNIINRYITKDISPRIVTAQAAELVGKFLKTNLIGIYPSSSAYPEISEKFAKLGWGCLVDFQHNLAYKELMVEFYSHMEFFRLNSGELLGFKTFVKGKEIIVTEEFLCKLLDISTDWIEYPKRNGFLESVQDTEENCLEFKSNLAMLSGQFVPDQWFDAPIDVPFCHLLPKFQFLTKIIKKNLTPFTNAHKTVNFFDLKFMREFMDEKVEVNLPYVLLTSIEQCHLKGVLGFGLVLTKIFKFLEFALDESKGKMIAMNTLYKQIIKPPKSLLVFGIEVNKEFLSECIIGQLRILHETQLLSLENQHIIIEQNKATHLKLDQQQASLNAISNFMTNLMPVYPGLLPNFQAGLAQSGDIIGEATVGAERIENQGNSQFVSAQNIGQFEEDQNEEQGILDIAILENQRLSNENLAAQQAFLQRGAAQVSLFNVSAQVQENPEDGSHEGTMEAINLITNLPSLNPNFSDFDLAEFLG